MSVFGRGNSPTNIFFSTDNFSFQPTFCFSNRQKLFFSPNDELLSFFSSTMNPRALFSRHCRFSVLHYREFRTFRTRPFLARKFSNRQFFFNRQVFFPTNILFSKPTKTLFFQMTIFFPFFPPV